MFGMSDDKLRVFMAAIIGTYRVALDPKAVIIPRKIKKNTALCHPIGLRHSGRRFSS